MRHEEGLCQSLVNAALRYATGNPSASFYDLRHTVFSFKAQQVLANAQNSDQLSLRDMSAKGGHAGVASTYAYIHLIEAVFATYSRDARPQAWLQSNEISTQGGVFEDICTGVIDYHGTDLNNCGYQVPELPTLDSFGLFKRHEILDKISDNLPLDAVAGEASVPLVVVQQALNDFVQVMAQIQMVNHSATGSELRQCNAVTSIGLWALHAHQPKYRAVSRKLISSATEKDFSSLNRIWQYWLLCRDHDDISLMNPRPAVGLIDFITGCGVAKRNMVVASDPNASPLSQEIARFSIPSRNLSIARNGRAQHRLFFTEPGVEAKSASGATISLLGFNWWMLVLGSFLLANEQI